MKKSKVKIAELSVDVYEPDGDPKGTLLFCHGAWVGGWIWEPFAAHFATLGYLGYAPTWRGRYDSKKVPDLGRVSIFDFVEDALAVARAVNADVVIGESMGGLIAQKVAEASPDIKGLVLLNSVPPFRVPASPTLIKKQAKYLGDLVFKRPNKPNEEDYCSLILNNVEEEEAQDFYKRICAESGRALMEMSMGKIKVDANRVKCPVYVIAGHLDAVNPPKVHAKVAQMYGAALAEYPSLSHHAFLEEGWEQVASELASWLEDKLTAGAR